MKRAFICCGCPSSGNRLMAGILVKAGCHGSGSTNQPKPEEVPVDHDKVVVIYHNDFDLNPAIDRFLANDYEVNMLVMVRDVKGLRCSLERNGFFDDEHPWELETREKHIEDWYKNTFSVITKHNLRFLVVSFESIIMRPIQAPREILKLLGLEIEENDGVYNVDLRDVGVYDANARWYGEKPAHSHRTAWADELIWWPQRGMGYYPVEMKKPSDVYDEAYWEKYESYEGTEIEKRINNARVALVGRHVPDDAMVVDIGIGCGTFIKKRPNTKGYDVNPVGIGWLKGNGLYFDPYEEMPEHITCWDSLEHIGDPARLISRVKNHVFIAIPIFEGADHVLSSKHFRPDEHYWYFTKDGLVDWMGNLGFECLEISDEESKAGREDILSFAFKRV